MYLRCSVIADPKALPAARLIIDMLPLSAQIQIACDTAKGAAARLAGIEIPKHDDTEATLDELKARIAKTLEFIKSIKPDQRRTRQTRFPRRHTVMSVGTR